MLGMVSYSRRLQSGQITCYLNRTYHVLPTTAIFLIAFSRELAYPRFPLESPCNPINMMPLLPLQCVSGVIPNIYEARAGRGKDIHSAQKSGKSRRVSGCTTT